MEGKSNSRKFIVAITVGRPAVPTLKHLSGCNAPVNRWRTQLLICCAAVLTAVSCDKANEPAGTSGPGGWLKGTTDEKLNTVAGQLRGFDATMVEVGYRYQELYWAGQDGNWDYASYQTEKIGTALKNGFERRPKRKASGEHFMDFVLPEMEKAIKARDSVLFKEKFEMMTVNCNACHTMEKMPFFTVRRPLVRQSPIRFQ